MADQNESFDAFLKRREVVSGDYINGHAGSLLKMSALSDPATFFPPDGQSVRGAEAVNAAHAQAAKSFGEGSVGHFEILQSGSDGELGFWTGIQHAEAVLKGTDKPVPMKLRVTEVFRLEDGAWKLVHQHADEAKD